MCCFVTALILMGPRAGLIVWWLLNRVRFEAAYDRFIWPFLGFLFLPWTTLMYTVAWAPLKGVSGVGWVLVGLGLLADIGSYLCGGWGNRTRFPGARDGSGGSLESEIPSSLH